MQGTRVVPTYIIKASYHCSTLLVALTVIIIGVESKVYKHMSACQSLICPIDYAIQEQCSGLLRLPLTPNNIYKDVS